MSNSGGPPDPNAPPPVPSPPPGAPGYPPAPPPYSSAGTPYAPRPVNWPPWLDVGLLVVGIGALLTFIGFLFGAGFAANAYGGGTTANAQGDLEAFFVVVGFGILLIVGGWFWRVIMVARRGRP